MSYVSATWYVVLMFNHTYTLIYVILNVYYFDFHSDYQLKLMSYVSATWYVVLMFNHTYTLIYVILNVYYFDFHSDYQLKLMYLRVISYRSAPDY